MTIKEVLLITWMIGLVVIVWAMVIGARIQLHRMNDPAYIHNEVAKVLHEQ